MKGRDQVIKQEVGDMGGGSAFSVRTLRRSKAESQEKQPPRALPVQALPLHMGALESGPPAQAPWGHPHHTQTTLRARSLVLHLLERLPERPLDLLF